MIFCGKIFFSSESIVRSYVRLNSRQYILFHVFNRSTSPNWWVWWYTPNGKRVQRSTRLPKDEFSREQAQSIISSDDAANGKLKERIFHAIQHIVKKRMIEELLDIAFTYSTKQEDYIEQARRIVPELGNGGNVI